MKQNWNIKSTPTSHYTGALVQGQAEKEAFPAFAGDGKGEVVHVAVKSKEPLAWVVEILDTADDIIQSVEFKEEDARLAVVDEVTYYFYDQQVRWGIPLTRVAVNVNLRNNSTTPKTAGTNGAVTLYFVLEK